MPGSLSTDLARAIDAAVDGADAGPAGRLRLDYQSLHRLTGRRPPVGVDALIRWSHPGHGEVAATETVALARRIGRAAHLNRLVLDEACRQLAAWTARLDPFPFVVAVNVSAHEVTAPYLIDNVASALSRTGARPDGLVLQLGPGFDEGSARFGQPVRDLADLGVDVMLDNVGPDYVERTALHDLPVSAIKLRADLLGRAVGSSDEADVLRRLVSTAGRLGVQVLAAGIEVEDDVRLALDLGCRLGQGLFLAPPGGASEVGEKLAAEAALLVPILGSADGRSDAAVER